jgi:hypothetical protein
MQEVEASIKRMVGEAIDIALEANMSNSSGDMEDVQCVEGFEYLYDQTSE